MKKGRKLASGITLSLAVMLAITACGNNNNNNNAASSPSSSQGSNQGSSQSASASTSASKPAKFSASIFDRGAVPADQGTYEDNRWTKWIDENANTDITWVPITRSQENDKYNVLVASGTAPDTISTYDRNILARFISQGWAQPIGDAIEQYSVEYKQYLSEHPELLPYLTFDGEMYAIASLRPTRAQTQIWIRQDYLDKLNLSVPTTIEGLIDVARAFRDGDPDGNGVNDTVPIALSGAHGPIIDDLFMARSGEWFIENGQATVNAFTGRYEDSMALRKLFYDEGLIHKEFITDQNHAMSKQNWVTGKAGIMFGTSTDGPTIELFENQPNAKLAAVPALTTKYGVNGYQKEVPNDILSIVKKNADIEGIIKYLDWLLREGWEPLTYGEEGVHYKLVDGQPVILDQKKWEQEVSFMEEYRLVHNNITTPESLAASAGDDPVMQEINRLKGEMIKISEATEYRKDFPYPPTVEEWSAISGQYQKKLEEVTTQVTIGGPDKTPEWGIKQMQQEWKNLDGDNIAKKVQAWYEANKANF